jgi:site-specific DNA-cytosine methylase
MASSGSPAFSFDADAVANLSPGHGSATAAMHVKTGTATRTMSVVQQSAAAVRDHLFAAKPAVGPYAGARSDILALHQLSQMSPQQLDYLTRGVNGLVSTSGGRLKIGTMCSGSDLIVPVFKQLWARIYQYCELPAAEVEHLFAVEVDQQKQRWILENGSPTYLFKDITLMGEETGMDVCSQQEVSIPRCDIVYVGFSCKTFSFLNQNRANSEYANALRDRAGSSGKTFGGLVEYVRVHRPVLIIMENVPSLVAGQQGKRNLEELGNMAAEFGYTLRYTVIDAEEYGLPQARNRAWVAMNYIGSGNQPGFSWQDKALADTLMQAFTVPPSVAFTVDDILWEVDSDEFRFWAGESLKSRAPRAVAKQKQQGKVSYAVKKKGRAMKKFYSAHAAAFGAASLKWPPPHGTQPSNSFTDKLCRRSNEILIFDEATCPRSSFSRRFVQLGQSLGRQSCRNERMPCLIPNGHLWERCRQGPVWGMEMLETQGMDLTMALAARNFRNSLLVDMAGDRKRANVSQASLQHVWRIGTCFEHPQL